MRIGVPSIVQKEHDATYSVAVESLQGAGTLWFSVDSAHADLLSTTADAALLGSLLPAMFAGEDVHIDGTVSERLYYHLSFAFQKLLLAHRPWLKPVRIIPARLESVMPDPGAGVATGFSGGIDSFCVLADHYAGVFDLEVWRDRRDDFLASLPRHPNPLMRELLVYARQQGVQVPAAALLRRYSGITWARDLSRRLSRQGPGRA